MGASNKIRVVRAGSIGTTVNSNKSRREESVKDLPEPAPRKLSDDDVKTLREAGFGELAEMVEPYVSR
jgi:hypothetical protein